MIQIEIRDREDNLVRKAQLPQRWDEFSVAQAHYVFKLISSDVDMVYANALLLYKLLGFPMKLANRLPFDEMYHLQECLFWVFSKLRHKKSFMPFLWCLGFRLSGPKEFMKNFSIGRYADANTLLTAYRKNEKDLSVLNRFIACLYLFPWQKHDSDKVERRAHKFYCVSLKTKQKAVLNFLGQNEYLGLTYPELFSGGKKESKKRSFGWNGIMAKLPGDAFGTIAKRVHEPLHDVLIFLEQQAVEAAQIEMDMESKRRGYGNN